MRSNKYTGVKTFHHQTSLRKFNHINLTLLSKEKKNNDGIELQFLTCVWRPQPGHLTICVLQKPPANVQIHYPTSKQY